MFDFLNKAYQQNTASSISVTKKINTEGKNYLSSSVSSSKYSGVFLYLIIGALSVTIAYNGSLIRAFGLACFVLVMDIFGAPPSTFSLYEGHVNVKRGQMRIKQLIQEFLSAKYNYNPIIQYSDILYVNARYYKDDEGGGEFYSYVLCYLQQNTLLEVNYVTSDLNYESMLRFLYLEKKVGTSLDGKYKKYKTVHS